MKKRLLSSTHSLDNAESPTKNNPSSIKLRSLNYELLETKHQVIKHVIKARSLEQKRHQVKLVDRLLKSKLEQIYSPFSPPKEIEQKFVPSSSNSKSHEYLDPMYYNLISEVSQLKNPALVELFLNKIVSCKDYFFQIKDQPFFYQDEIIPDKQSFYQYLSLISRNMISKYDCDLLFEFSESILRTYLSSKHGSKLFEDCKTITTSLLTIRIHKEILLDIAYKTILNHFLIQLIFEKRNLFGFKQLQTSSDISLNNPFKPFQFDLNPLDKFFRQQHGISSNPSKQHILKFLQENKSLLMQNQSTLKQTTKNYLKTNAMIRAITIISQYHLRVLYHSFYYWKNHFNVFTTIVQKVKQSNKLIGTCKLFQFTKMKIQRILQKYFQHFIQTIVSEKYYEYYAACLIIQSLFRGYQIRKNIRKIRAEKSIILIQKVIRVLLAKYRIRKMKWEQIRNKSSSKIVDTIRRYILILKYRRLRDYRRKVNAAILIQTSQRRYIANKNYIILRTFYRKFKGAIKIQTHIRKYLATKRVRRMLSIRKKLKATIRIQTFGRSIIAKRKVKKIRLHMRSCIKIQQWIRRFLKRRLYLKWYYSFAYWKLRDFSIQNIKKQRFKHFYSVYLLNKKLRLEAEDTLSPILLGHLIRKRYNYRYAPNERTKRRKQKKLATLIHALFLGKKARKFVKENKMFLKREVQISQKLKSSKSFKHIATPVILIQSLARGYLVRQKYLPKLPSYSRKLAISRALSMRQSISAKISLFPESDRPTSTYYLLRQAYWDQQNEFHYNDALKIQCWIRTILAKQKVQMIRDHLKYVEESLDFSDPKSLKYLTVDRLSRRFSSSPKIIIYNIIIIQAFFRGRIVRMRMRRKHDALKPIKWLLKELKIRRKISKGLKEFRAVKELRILRNKSAIKIQTFIRKVITLRKFRKSYRSLVRQREIRKREKRIKACIIIQCIFRIHLAKKIVAQKSSEYKERQTFLREMEELEKSLVGIHDEFLHDLNVIKAQTGIRAYLAKSEFERRLNEHKKKLEDKKSNERKNSSIIIQALIRGKLARNKYKKNLPNLRKARKQRGYCVECEENIARRRCRQCKDKFCVDCFDYLHQKGNRKNHSWENVQVQSYMFANDRDTVTGGKPQNELDQKKRAEEWEEFYDSAAKAKYWFNKITGEASWISPFN